MLWNTATILATCLVGFPPTPTGWAIWPPAAAASRLSCCETCDRRESSLAGSDGRTGRMGGDRRPSGNLNGNGNIGNFNGNANVGNGNGNGNAGNGSGNGYRSNGNGNGTGSNGTAPRRSHH